VLATDAVTLAADRRLRVEEAVDAVGSGAFFIALIPAQGGENVTSLVVFLGGCGLVSSAAWWHARRGRANALLATPREAA
jgi:hypothetical protein